MVTLSWRGLALVMCLRGPLADSAIAQQSVSAGVVALDPVVPAALEVGYDGATVPATYCEPGPAISAEPTWITPPMTSSPYVNADVHVADPGWGGPVVSETCPCPSNAWYWQALPDGLIYHSYWAGVHEPRWRSWRFTRTVARRFGTERLAGGSDCCATERATRFFRKAGSSTWKRPRSCA